MFISYDEISILGVKSLVAFFAKEIMHLIVKKWKMCLEFYDFLQLGAFNDVRYHFFAILVRCI